LNIHPTALNSISPKVAINYTLGNNDLLKKSIKISEKGEKTPFIFNFSC